MFFFRLFHLKSYAKPEKYSLIYTSNVIYDHAVNDNIGLWREETIRVTKLIYNRTNEDNAYNVGEEAAEPNGGNALGT